MCNGDTEFLATQPWWRVAVMKSHHQHLLLQKERCMFEKFQEWYENRHSYH